MLGTPACKQILPLKASVPTHEESRLRIHEYHGAAARGAAGHDYRHRWRHNSGVSTTFEAPANVELDETVSGDDVERDKPWIVIVWNDPINLMSYVTLVLQKLFGYSRTKATRLMLQVHNEGKAVVSSGTREKAEYDVSRLHAHGLWATMRQD
jgi:ATP-dependent Clp protease adaptor protein ClpS